MTAEEIYNAVQEKFGEAIIEFDAEAPDPVIKVKPEAWLEICKYLQNEPGLAFDNLINLNGFDYGEGKDLGMIVHLFSFRKRHHIALKTDLPRENPALQSIESLWKTADWHEREAFDLYGIVFENHPDLRRILCPDDWEGFPLRKDYVVQEFYHGIRVPYKEDWNEFSTLEENPDRGHYVFKFERDIPKNGAKDKKTES